LQAARLVAAVAELGSLGGTTTIVISALQKDESIIRLLDRLESHLGKGAFVIMDHWEGDLCAVGIARPDNHCVLVYICTAYEPADTYFVSLELPPKAGEDQWANHPYTPAGEQRVHGFDALLHLVKRHFGYDRVT
jgi:hypothetical protein